MLFSRREPLPPSERFMRALWPHCGWRRSARYAWLRLTRTQSSPHAIAIGVAAGIFASFVPLIGIQMTLAAALAYLLRGNILGAVAGTFIGTPVTYPLMWLGSYRVGAWLLGHDIGLLKTGTDRLWALLASGRPGTAAEAADQAADVLAPMIKPLLIGSGILGLAAGVAAYYSLLALVTRMKARRMRAGGSAASIA